MLARPGPGGAGPGLVQDWFEVGSRSSIAGLYTAKLGVLTCWTMGIAGKAGTANEGTERPHHTADSGAGSLHTVQHLRLGAAG